MAWVECLGRDTVSLCKVGVYDDLFATDQQYSLLNLADLHERFRLPHSPAPFPSEVVADCDPPVNPSSDPNAQDEQPCNLHRASFTSPEKHGLFHPLVRHFLLTS